MMTGWVADIIPLMLLLVQSTLRSGSFDNSVTAASFVPIGRHWASTLPPWLTKESAPFEVASTRELVSTSNTDDHGSDDGSYV